MEKWLLAPSLRIGHQWLESVTRAGQPVAMALGHGAPPGDVAMSRPGQTLIEKTISLAIALTTGRRVSDERVRRRVEICSGYQNTQLDTVQDDIETLVMDAEVLESVIGAPDPEKKGKKLTIQLIARLRKHAGDPKFVALGERLEKIVTLQPSEVDRPAAPGGRRTPLHLAGHRRLRRRPPRLGAVAQERRTAPRWGV